MTVSELSKQCFAQYPVWAWCDDETSHCAVEAPEPLPDDRGALFVRAAIHTAAGAPLDGYVIVDDAVFGIGLFIDDRELVLNKRLVQIAGEEIDDLCAHLNAGFEQIFPLKYQTEFHYEGEEVIAGAFDFLP